MGQHCVAVLRCIVSTGSIIGEGGVGVWTSPQVRAWMCILTHDINTAFLLFPTPTPPLDQA